MKNMKKVFMILLSAALILSFAVSSVSAETTLSGKESGAFPTQEVPVSYSAADVKYYVTLPDKIILGALNEPALSGNFTIDFVEPMDSKQVTARVYAESAYNDNTTNGKWYVTSTTNASNKIDYCIQVDITSTHNYYAVIEMNEASGVLDIDNKTITVSKNKVFWMDSSWIAYTHHAEVVTAYGVGDFEGTISGIRLSDIPAATESYEDTLNFEFEFSDKSTT